MIKKIIDAKPDEKGNIGGVRFLGNQQFTPIPTAVKMADKGQIDGYHAVHPTGSVKPFLRANPDSKKNNNLDEMAKG